MSTLWTVPVYRNADEDNDLIGVVLMDGEDIIGFISSFDFRDTNMDGVVSLGERIFGSVGFNRAIFVSTAIKQLEQLAADPNAPVFDYGQIPQLRFANMMHGLGEVAIEVLQEAAVDFLVGRFAGPVIEQILDQMLPDSVPQFMLTFIGETWLASQINSIIPSIPSPLGFEGYDVSFVGERESDDVVATGDGSGSQVVYSVSPTRSITTGDFDDTVILGVGQSVTINGGGGRDTAISDMTSGSGPVVIAEFATETAEGLRLFNGVTATGVEAFEFSFGGFEDFANLSALQDDLTVRIDFGGGDDTAIAPSGRDPGEGYFRLEGGDGVDTFIVDYTGSDRAMLLQRVGSRPDDFVWGADDASRFELVGITDDGQFYYFIGAAYGFEQTEIIGSDFGDQIQTVQLEFVFDGDAFRSSTASFGDLDSITQRPPTNDTIFAGAGDDFIISGAGVDFIDGGEGYDNLTIYMVDSDVPVDVDGSFSTASGFMFQNGTTVRNVEGLFLYATVHDDVVTNRIDGAAPPIDMRLTLLMGQGDDSFDAVGVNYTAVGMAGFDTATIDLTDETYHYFVFQNLLDDGSLVYELSAYDDRTRIGLGSINGFESVEFIFGNSDILMSLAPIENVVTLGGGDDDIDGNIMSDVLNGGAGDDTITSRAGVDILIGGAGDDRLYGGSDVDTAVFSGRMEDYTITYSDRALFSSAGFIITGPDGEDRLVDIEFAQFDDQTIRLRPGTGVSVNFDTADPSEYQDAMEAIRDFDGNDLGGDGFWLRIGSADVNGDGDIDQILVNDAIGRFATVGTAPDGLVYFDDHGWAGETRVAGIYIDPLVLSGDVVQGSDFDSQRRFQNDLEIENINRVLGANDYDGDGIWEVYFALTDGTAYLRALMHEDGNIRYANYQSEQEVIDYLTANGFDEATFGDWFTPPASGQAEAPKADAVPYSVPPELLAAADGIDSPFRPLLEPLEPEFYG